MRRRFLWVQDLVMAICRQAGLIRNLWLTSPVGTVFRKCGNQRGIAKWYFRIAVAPCTSPLTFHFGTFPDLYTDTDVMGKCFSTDLRFKPVTGNTTDFTAENVKCTAKSAIWKKIRFSVR